MPLQSFQTNHEVLLLWGFHEEPIKALLVATNYSLLLVWPSFEDVLKCCACKRVSRTQPAPYGGVPV